MSRTLLFLVFLIASCGAFAAAQPIVRAELSSDHIAIGESVELKITVLVPTWFSRPLVYPHLELANTITRLPDDSSYPIRESVGQESWSGIVRSYKIFPLLAANYTFSGRKVSIEYANPGADPVSLEMGIPQVSFRAAAPPGSESLEPYIAGSEFTLELKVLGDAGELAAGDALVIEYIAELDGLPAMFLPPLAPDMSFDGVSIYADTPVVDDGDKARRSEKLTLVFDGGGQFAIPGVALNYWNTETESIEAVTTQDIPITVTGAPAATANELEPDQAWTLPLAIVVVLAVLGGLIYKWGPAALKFQRERRETRSQSEPVLFSRVQSVLKANNDRESYDAILFWLERVEAGLSMRQFAQTFGDDSLVSELSALSGKLYGSNEQGVDFVKLASDLRAARTGYLRSRSPADADSLPSLNP